MAESSNNRQRKKSIVGRLIAFVSTACFILLISLVFSISTEWVGMSFFWPEEGVKHSINMAETEVEYLNDDFRKSLIVQSPKQFVLDFTQTVNDYLFIKTGAKQLIIDNLTNPTARHIIRVMAEHALAAMYTTQVFFIRLSILVLAMPVFLIVAFIAAVEGLVQRDIRKWSIGREHAAVYHYAKRGTSFFFIAPWVIYLSLPFSIHPNYVILPFVALFAFGIFLATYLFKKYI